MPMSNKTLADALRAAAAVFEAADAEEIPAAEAQEANEPIAEEIPAAMGATDAKPAEIADAVKEVAAAKKDDFAERLAKAMELLKGGK